MRVLFSTAFPFVRLRAGGVAGGAAVAEDARRTPVVAPLPGAGRGAGPDAAAPDSGGRLVIGISSRALFDLDESHRIYRSQGVEAFRRYQVKHEEEPLKPGGAFHLVRKLLRINELPGRRGRVEVILLSRNSADTGLRVFNSIEHHGLAITCAAFCGGCSPHRYVSAFGVHLFLSIAPEDVENALRSGVAAATLIPSAAGASDDGEVRFAFDGDAVLFSDQAERVYHERGLAAFAEDERRAAAQPLDGGPFKPFLAELHRLQSAFAGGASPIRTALVTARAAPAHKRVITTLRDWGIRLDEVLFLGGRDKTSYLKAYGADVFFDDQMKYCDSASREITTGHVPHGVANLPADAPADASIAPGLSRGKGER